MEDEECPVDCWVLPLTTSCCTLRYALYRLMVRHLRCQGKAAPPLTVGGMSPHLLEFFNARPLRKRGSTEEQQDGFDSEADDSRRFRPPRLRTIYFPFNKRIISATGTQADTEHPHVLRLWVNRSFLDRILPVVVTGLLPSLPARWLRSRSPELFLPAQIVLKRKIDDHTRSFDAERAAYDRLRPLQGKVMPVLLGQIEYDGARAPLLSDIGGVCLAEPAGEMVLRKAWHGMGLGVDGEEDGGKLAGELGRLIGEALGQLAVGGLLHDVKLDNFHLVGEGQGAKIMVVDLEQVDLDLSEEDDAWVVRENV